MYVGISAGSLLAGPLAAGIPPEEMLKSLYGRSRRISRLRVRDFYHPNLSETVSKLWSFGRDAVGFYPAITSGLADYLKHNYKEIWARIGDYARHPDLENLERILRPMIRSVGQKTNLPNAGTYIPGGLFDNQPLERYIRENLERNRLPNNFRLLRHFRRRDLYISATSLDTADEVVFGPDARCDITIAEAVMASSAVPLFYRPARIRGEDFLDGAVRTTANVTFAAAKGADLIICYNPFRPFRHSEMHKLLPQFHNLGDLGVFTILSQAIRTMLHSRLMLSIESLARDPDFKGDLILIEPLEEDAEFFSINPLAFWRRAESAQHGFATAKKLFEENHRELTAVFERYGIRLDLRTLRMSGEKLSEARLNEQETLNLLEQPSIPRRLHMR